MPNRFLVSIAALAIFSALSCANEHGSDGELSSELATTSTRTDGLPGDGDLPPGEEDDDDACPFGGDGTCGATCQTDSCQEGQGAAPAGGADQVNGDFATHASGLGDGTPVSAAACRTACMGAGLNSKTCRVACRALSNATCCGVRSAWKHFLRHRQRRHAEAMLAVCQALCGPAYCIEGP